MRMERKIKKFYSAWSPSVFAFACLLLGEGVDAERTTAEAFQAYLSRGLDLDALQLPVLLLIYALDAARQMASTSAQSGTHNLRDAVLLLPWKQSVVEEITKSDYWSQRCWGCSWVLAKELCQHRSFWTRAIRSV
jgi:hypothetical protein